MPGDDDFTGPVRGRDRVKAGFRKVGAFNKRIQDKFQARRARFGNKGIGGYRRGGGD